MSQNAKKPTTIKYKRVPSGHIPTLDEYLHAPGDYTEQAKFDRSYEPAGTFYKMDPIPVNMPILAEEKYPTFTQVMKEFFNKPQQPEI